MPLFKTNCFLFILLAIATLVCYHRLDQYQQTGPELLTGNWKFRTTESSRIDITDEGLTLFSSDAKIGASAHRDLRMVKPGTVLLVSADMKCDNVKAGKHTWNTARLLLAQNNGKKRPLGSAACSSGSDRKPRLEKLPQGFHDCTGY